MFIEKLANAAASLITVTSTATSLFDLVDTAGSTASGLGTKNLNAVDISVEDGDIRMLMDGNTPTTTEGVLLSSGNTYYFRGIPLSKFLMVRASTDVKCSIQVGTSQVGENTTSSAHEVTLEAGDVTIGDVGIIELGGQTLPIDDAAMIADPVFTPSGGEYRAADDTYTDGDAVVDHYDINGNKLIRSKAYDSSTQADRTAEINPLNMQFVGETLIDETNIAETTTAYAYIDMAGYTGVGIQAETSGATPTDVLTVTLEASIQDDGTAQASCDYQDVTLALTGSASFVDTDFTALIDTPIPVKYLRVKYTTSTGGGNDADLTVYTKKLW